ncbi:hypothetical protein [Rhodococcus koreensis]|uniref:hypothetical protein n=1 Tax=Rhodococcus koreensis TaxID=99653 RepID=UPI0036DD371C
MTPNDRDAPIPANRVIDEPWRTAVTDPRFAERYPSATIAAIDVRPVADAMN